LIATTAYASIIRPLQLLIIIVAGLFFLRVLRVVMVEVRPPDDDGRVGRKSRRGQAMGLQFIEPLDREGERIDVEGTLTVGRNSECDLPLSDTYLSSRHARFLIDEGDLVLEDLGSTNGSYVNQVLIDEPTVLRRGDIVQVGGVLFEVVR
jgi:hypothetical protein